jgi:hypothetical protein
VSEQIPASILQKLRKFIREAKWKTASSPAYRSAPHSYVIAFWFKEETHDGKTAWKWFADLIRDYGEYRTWRGHRYKYLILDGHCFWVDFPALNKAKADTLD